MAQLSFAKTLVRNEPFVPDSVWKKFKVLDELFVNVKIADRRMRIDFHAAFLAGVL